MNLVNFAFAQGISSPLDLTGFIQEYCRSGVNLNFCLQGIYNLLVAIAVVVAFFMFLFGAFENLLSVIPDVKMQGKNRMKNAIIGLGIIFVSGVLLYWINPSIFNARLIIYQVQFSVPEVIIEEGEIKLPPGMTLEDIQRIGKIKIKGGEIIDIGPQHLVKFTLRTKNSSVTVTVHKIFAEKYLKKVNENLKNVEYIFDPRQTGGVGERSNFSGHPFGLAIDINASKNPLTYNTTSFQTDMPKEFVDAWIKAGVGWGGNWFSKKDPMHFSILPNEALPKHTKEYYKKIRCNLPDRQEVVTVKVQDCPPIPPTCPQEFSGECP
jgi:hypothetical protein